MPGTIHKDIRYQPLYTMGEVAGYTRANPSTLRTWAVGRQHPYKEAVRYSPVLSLSERNRPDPFSFINMVETHVLVALRKTHSIPLPVIRSAVSWLRKETGSQHPLAELDIETDGLNLLIRRLGKLLSASEQGQVVMREVVEQFLRRVDRDAKGLPILFYPFTQNTMDNSAPRDVVINPSVAFGRPVVKGTRITTAIIFERYTAGESLLEIADDYNLEMRTVEEALRCEIERKAA